MTTLSGQHGKEYLLTAFLNLPVEEEVSIKTKYNAYYLNKVSKPEKFQELPQQCRSHGTVILVNICLLLKSKL